MGENIPILSPKEKEQAHCSPSAVENYKMKEATGELNMTLVVIIAIAAIMAFAMWFVPQIINSANNTWDNSINQKIPG